MKSSDLWPFVSITVLLLCSCRAEGLASPKATSTLAFKGYELYSWPAEDGWYFALLLGTNRIKTYEEVIASDTRLEGTDALKEQLASLSRGEHVFWVVSFVPNMVLPPDAVVDEMSDYCQQMGVQLFVGR